MGGDANPAYINHLAEYAAKRYPFLKIGWYTGREAISEDVDLKNFDYIKVGPYIKDLGGLSSPATNQRMFKILHLGNKERKVDITRHFQN